MLKSAFVIAGLFGCTAEILMFRSFSDIYQEVPPPVNKVPDEATASASYTLDTETGEVVVGEGSTYSDLTGEATSCHIHVGFRGKDGPAVITLSCVNGVVSGNGILSEEDMDVFIRGDMYLNIHTEKNIPGEIRGQIDHYTANEAIEFESFSDAKQTVPPPIKVPEGATATAHYTFNEVTGEVTVGEGSTYSGLSGNATSCHIHLGFPGKDGPAIITLSCVNGVVSGSGFLTGDDIHIFQDGNMYLMIHTEKNIPGEIRGQIQHAKEEETGETGETGETHTASGQSISSANFAADTEWKYKIGPFEFVSPTDFNNGITCPVTGRIYGRVSGDLTEVQWKYDLDNLDSYPSYAPIFAMHLHHGAMVEGEFGGHVVASIAGEGDIRGCVTAGPSDVDPTVMTYKVCSELCLEGDLASDCIQECLGEVYDMDDPVAAQIAMDAYEAAGLWPLPGLGMEKAKLGQPKPVFRQMKPFPVLCNFSMSVATACNGGCQGDARDGNKDGGSIVPSRYCDFKDEKSSSDAPQNHWLYAKYSHEMSGNETDGDEYSKWSIFKPGNFDKFCGTKLHFLRELLSPGDKSYIALHLNFNASGSSSLNFGDLIATVNDGSGVTLHDVHGNAVEMPEEKVCNGGEGGEGEEWPYVIDPIEFENFPEINGVSHPLIARMEGRINCNWDELQVKLTIDNEEEYPDYFPIFATHIHHGKPREGTTGHVVGTIAGVGDIRGCVSAYFDENFDLAQKFCSSKCSTIEGTFTACDRDCQGPLIDGNLPIPELIMQLQKGGVTPQTARMFGLRVPDYPMPEPQGGGGFPIVCNVTLGPAYGCNGGCLDDERPEFGSIGLAPSRYCDMLDSERPSDMRRDTWVTVKNSFEMSGNDVDDDYSPYSINKRGFFDRWCNIKLHFLKHMLRDDFGAYVALHLDFNYTGTASSNFGDMFAIINDGTGTQVRDRSGNIVEIPEDDNVKAVKETCSSESHACCHPGSSCDSDSISTNCVCKFDSFCCDGSWDHQCVEEAQLACGLVC